MKSVKVRKSGISSENAADVIRRGLGEGYRVQPGAGGEVLVRKGTFGRAKVHMHEESGGTVFEVKGTGYTPVLMFANERGIARRTAEVLSQAAEYRDDS